MKEMSSSMTDEVERKKRRLLGRCYSVVDSDLGILRFRMFGCRLPM